MERIQGSAAYSPRPNQSRSLVGGECSGLAGSSSDAPYLSCSGNAAAPAILGLGVSGHL